jgi:cytochrome b pre-mRNA-processing protein 3
MSSRSTALNLPPTFSTWAQTSMLHMYLIHAQMRCYPREESLSIRQQFVDQFFFDAERMMDVNHAMTSSSARQRYLKVLFEQWLGVIVAYDEGVMKGDAVLAAAVWRNLLKANPDADMRVLAAIVSWMRYNLQRLEQMDFADLIMAGKQIFSHPPTAEFQVVDQLAGALRPREKVEDTKSRPARPGKPSPGVLNGRGL